MLLIDLVLGFRISNGIELKIENLKILVKDRLSDRDLKTIEITLSIRVARTRGYGDPFSPCPRLVQGPMSAQHGNTD